MSDDTGRLSGETDSTLVEMAQRAPDDTRPFEELLRRHQGFVVANCRYITRSAADAEDLGQEVFVKAFFAMRRFEARAQFRTWLGRIKGESLPEPSPAHAWGGHGGRRGRRDRQ